MVVHSLRARASTSMWCWLLLSVAALAPSTPLHLVLHLTTRTHSSAHIAHTRRACMGRWCSRACGGGVGAAARVAGAGHSRRVRVRVGHTEPRRSTDARDRARALKVHRGGHVGVRVGGWLISVCFGLRRSLRGRALAHRDRARSISASVGAITPNSVEQIYTVFYPFSLAIERLQTVDA